MAGTVFQDDGRLLRGATVTLRADPEGGAPTKFRPVSIPSDARGEFAFRVPAAPMRYTVGVRAAGFKPQEKPASISGDERVDVFFQMERAQPQK